MALTPFPGTDQYSAITISGLYDNNTESPLFAPSGTTVPTSGLAIGGSDASGFFQVSALDQSANSLSFPGLQFKVGAAWTSATSGGTFQYSNGSATPLSVQPLSGAPAYVVQLDQTTTITGGAVTFQGTYDNINWVTIPVAQVLNPNTFAQLTNPFTFIASTQSAFLILSQGYAAIRADLSTAITGTGSVTPYWTSLSYEPAIASSSSSTVSGTLSNNTAAPIADNVGVLGFIAETAYNTVTYTTGNQVLAVTDLHGAINSDLQASAGVQLGATAVTAFGTAPAAANVIGVNANIYQAGAAIAVANTLFTQISDGASAMGTMANWGTNPGAVKALNTNSFVFNTTAAPIFVSGTLTNNNAAPAANNIGSLVAITVSGAFPAVTTPVLTAGDQELLTVSQGGSLITIPADEQYASHISYFADDSGFTTLITLPNATLVPLISIQSNSAAISFLIREVQGYGDGSQIKFVLVKNPQTLTGAAFTATGIPTGSHIKRDTTATAVTIGTGTVVWSGMGASASAHNDQLLQALAAGAPGDTYTFAAQKFGTGTSKAFGMIRWSEEAAAI
jgi:hypothetical protein